MLLSYLRKEMNSPTCGQLPTAERAQAALTEGVKTHAWIEEHDWIQTFTW